MKPAAAGDQDAHVPTLSSLVAAVNAARLADVA